MLSAKDRADEEFIYLFIGDLNHKYLNISG